MAASVIAVLVWLHGDGRWDVRVADNKIDAGGAASLALVLRELTGLTKLGLCGEWWVVVWMAARDSCVCMCAGLVLLG